MDNIFEHGLPYGYRAFETVNALLEIQQGILISKSWNRFNDLDAQIDQICDLRDWADSLSLETNVGKLRILAGEEI